MARGRKSFEKLAEPRPWADVAMQFQEDTGISIGIPAVAGEELDFLDHRAWEGRDPALVQCLDSNVVGPLVGFVKDEVLGDYRPKGKVRRSRSGYIDEHEETARRVRLASEAAAKALMTPRVIELLEPAEIDAMHEVAEIGARHWISEPGRPPEKYVAAIKALMAILGRLRRRNGSLLRDSDMARLVSLVYPVLLRVDHKKVVDLVRKHRSSYILRVIDKSNSQKVLITYYEHDRPETSDYLAVKALWPSSKVDYIRLPGEPPRWTRKRGDETQPGPSSGG